MTKNRMDEARRLVEEGRVHPKGGPFFEVRSERGVYLVDLRDPRCTCPDNVYRGSLCKHILASQLYRKAREEKTVTLTLPLRLLRSLLNEVESLAYWGDVNGEVPHWVPPTRAILKEAYKRAQEAGEEEAPRQSGGEPLSSSG